MVTGRLVSLAVFIATLFCSSPAACILCGKSPENEVGFLIRAARQNGLMAGCTCKCPWTPNPAENCGGCSKPWDWPYVPMCSRHGMLMLLSTEPGWGCRSLAGGCVGMHPAEPMQDEQGNACSWGPRRMKVEGFCCELGSRLFMNCINEGWHTCWV